MKRQSKVFRSRFRMLVEAQLDLLKSEDWDYLLNYDLDAEQVTLEDIHHLNDNDLTPEERAMKESQSQAENNNGTTSTSDLHVRLIINQRLLQLIVIYKHSIDK